MKHLWTLAALLLAAPAAAQPALGPGSASLHAEELRPAVDTLDLLASRAGGEFVAGMLVLRTERVGATLLRVERMVVNGAAVSVDSFTVDGRTLAPIAVTTTHAEEKVEFRFAEGRVTSTADGSSVDRRIAEPVFYGNSVDLVLGALPLREGYEARLRFFDAPDAPTRLRVEAADEVAAGDGGLCPAWRVEVEGGDHGGTYWISRDTHALVRYDSDQGFRILRRSGCASPPSATRTAMCGGAGYGGACVKEGGDGERLLAGG